jgi:hypothetical protein
MRHFKLPIAILVFGIAIFLSADHIFGVTRSNSVCDPSGGCSSPCVNGQSGSSETINASQLTMCSPQNLSNCSSNSTTNGVCGVHYSYSGSNCDATTITNSYYIYNYFCSSN